MILTAIVRPVAWADEADSVRQRLESRLTDREAAAAGRWIAARRVPLDGTADSVDEGVILSADGRSIDKLLVRESTGERLSIVDLRRRQMDEWQAAHGKLTPRLVRALAPGGRAADADRLEVLVWVDPPRAEPRPARLATTEAVRAWKARTWQAQSRALQLERAEVERAVPATGGRLLRALHGMPILVVEVPVDRIDALAALPDVRRIDLPSTEADAGPVDQAMWFWDADDDEALETFSWTGVQGTGINVGVYEWSNYCGLWRENATTPAGFSDLGGYTLSGGSAAVYGCDQPGVSDGDPCDTVCNNDAGYCRGGRCMKRHVTQVASKLGSVRDGEVRNASRMNLFYANVGNRSERMDWLVAHGVTVANDSEGSANDAPINYAIRTWGMSLTHAVGNSQGAPVDCFDNGICVGSYSIVDTANIDAWKTDPLNSGGAYQLSGSTAFIDSASHWDAEKPDVMGDGEASLQSPMITPSTGEWGGSAGTSFAAPMVGGLVALLQEYFPTAQVWPELVRAMLMASAIDHNVLGVSLSRNGGSDEIDGAGVPTASALKKIVDDGTYVTLSVTPAYFDAAGQYLPPGSQITLQPGETVRSVLSWCNCVESGMNLQVADFDLWLRDHTTGTLVDWSISRTNNIEMIQYTNDSGQTRSYDQVVVNYGFSPCDGVAWENGGLAWTIRDVDLGPAREYEVTKTADTADSVCDGDCSLREAITLANATPGRDLITLGNHGYVLSRAGASENANYTGDLDVTDDLDLRGEGRLQSTISGGGLDRVLHVLNGADLRLDGLSLTLGNVAGPGGALAVEGGDAILDDVLVILNTGTNGGGISSAGGSLVLRGSDVQNNTANGFGGGIYLDGGTTDISDGEVVNNVADNGGGLYNAAGFAWLHRSTLSGNDATVGKGGGIRNFGDLQLDNCTVDGNTAVLEGGGIWSSLGSTTALVRSTLAANSAPSGSALWSRGDRVFYGSLISGACSGGGSTVNSSATIESPGDSCGLDAVKDRSGIVEVRLGELGSYGGRTRTRPPMPGSPAIDPGLPPPSVDSPIDQRGLDRPLDGDNDGSSGVDSGSVELLGVEIRMASTSEVTWLGSPEATSYRVYRGALSDLVDADANGIPDFGYGACVSDTDPDPQDTTYADAGVPATGTGWFYLVEPITPVGSTGLGWSTAGRKRGPSSTCP